MTRERLTTLVVLLLLMFVAAFWGFKVNAQTRRKEPSPFILIYKTPRIAVMCEKETGNRVYHAYRGDGGGLAVVPGGCPAGSYEEPVQ